MSIYELALVLGFAGQLDLLRQSEIAAELKGETIYITPLPCGSFAVWSDKDTRNVRHLPSKNRARKIARKLISEAV